MDVRELLDKIIKYAREKSSRALKVEQHGKTVKVTIECSEEVFKEMFGQPYWRKIDAPK